MREELVQAIALLGSGERARVNEAIKLLQNTVYSFSMKVCGHREDAEDTMQEVLFKALPHLAKLEDPRALAVWLYRVTRNQCWMRRRKERASRDKALPLESLMPDQKELAALLADPGRSPEEAAIGKQDRERLHRAVLRIPPKYRLILVLHDMEELDASEIAKVTSLREGTVRVRLHRARLLLRRELAGMPSGRGGRKRPSRGRQPARRASAECREMFASLSEYLDQQMDPAACEKMRRHIEHCPPCVAFLRDLERVVARCREMEAGCAPHTAAVLRNTLTREYLRLLGSAPA
jgi:RNA polymerase sigma-70 factor (ECF subfamily)